MGGRSDNSKKQTLPDSWNWLTELTDERLDNYGKHSVIQSAQDYAAEKSTSARHHTSANNLNYYAQREYERRHGVLPAWADKDKNLYTKNSDKKG